MIIRYENKILAVFYYKHFSKTIKHKIERDSLSVITMKDCSSWNVNNISKYILTRGMVNTSMQSFPKNDH